MVSRRPAHGPALVVAALLCALGLAAGCLWAPAARADGDPASDVLTEQPVFVPPGSGVPATDELRLEQVVAAAHRAGFAIRVAVIANRASLGAVTGLWRRPADYAQFLGRELSYVFHGTELVVMPNGYGVWITGPDGTPAAREHAGAALVGARLPPSASTTAAVAVSAVQRLAAQRGIRLPAPRLVAPHASGSALHTGPIGWAALVLGAVMIVVAWGASLRQRPWRSRARSA